MGNYEGRDSGPDPMALVRQDEELQRALSAPLTQVRAMMHAFDLFRQRGIQVLSPAITAISPGYGVALSIITCEETDIYKVPGSSDVALGKNALNRIAAAAGIQWDPEGSRRLDDGSDPLYCRYRVAAFMLATDGTPQSFFEEKELDLRDGSAQVREYVRTGLKTNQMNHKDGVLQGSEILLSEPDYEDPAAVRAWRSTVARYNAAIWAMPRERRPQNKWGKAATLRDPFDQVDQVASHLLSHTITKAKNRLLRSALGVPVSGPASSLRGFLVAKPYFSGDFGDERLNMMAAQMITETAMEARRSLFGGRGASAAGGRPEQPAAPAQQELEPAPAVGVLEAEESVDGHAGRSAEDDPSAALRALDRGDQIAMLLTTARRKGKLGSDDGQITEQQIGRWSEDKLAVAFAKLVEMPDVSDDEGGAWEPPAEDEDPIPW